MSTIYHEIRSPALEKEISGYFSTSLESQKDNFGGLPRLLAEHFFQDPDSMYEELGKCLLGIPAVARSADPLITYFHATDKEFKITGKANQELIFELKRDGLDGMPILEFSGKAASGKAFKAMMKDFGEGFLFSKFKIEFKKPFCNLFTDAQYLTCPYCNMEYVHFVPKILPKNGNDGYQPDIEHVRPKSSNYLGLSVRLPNLVLGCEFCNRKIKGDTSLADFGLTNQYIANPYKIWEDGLESGEKMFDLFSEEPTPDVLKGIMSNENPYFIVRGHKSRNPEWIKFIEGIIGSGKNPPKSFYIRQRLELRQPEIRASVLNSYLYSDREFREMALKKLAAISSVGFLDAMFFRRLANSKDVHSRAYNRLFHDFLSEL